MTASSWYVGGNRSDFPSERLIEHSARVKAGGQGYGGSQRPVHGLDLQMVRTGRGWLFECPRGCGRAVLHVYLPPDGEPGCRRCCKLDYACRRVARDMPEAARSAKLREKIGADPRPFSPLPPRKRWARRVTWLRTLRAIAEQEDRLAARFAGMTRDLERRARVRKLTVAS
jgi:hypothetical protein